MKILALFLLFFSSSVFARDVYVKGYTRSDGTYVPAHYRTAPDSSTYNNYSTQGNVNPYTGESGTTSSYTNYYQQSAPSQPYQSPYQQPAQWQNLRSLYDNTPSFGE